MAWFGYWIFLSVLIVCDALLYSKGHSCFIYDHKSEHEERLREAAVKRAECEAKELAAKNAAIERAKDPT